MYRLAFLAVIAFQIEVMRAAETAEERGERQDREHAKGGLAGLGCAVVGTCIAPGMLPKNSPWYATILASAIGFVAGFELGTRAVMPRGGYADKETNHGQNRPAAEVYRERFVARVAIIAGVAAYGASKYSKSDHS